MSTGHGLPSITTDTQTQLLNSMNKLMILYHIEYKLPVNLLNHHIPPVNQRDLLSLNKFKSIILFYQ